MSRRAVGKKREQMLVAGENRRGRHLPKTRGRHPRQCQCHFTVKEIDAERPSAVEHVRR